MSKKLTFWCILILVAGMVKIASATPVSFTEIFLGSGTDGQYFNIQRGEKAVFSFDLTKAGNLAGLFDRNNNLKGGSLQTPTEDEAGYDVNLYQAPFEGTLSFIFSDNDLLPENVEIWSLGDNGNPYLIRNKWYWLGSWGGGREYTTLTVDLKSGGLLNYLADGKFLSIALCPDIILNNIRLDQASLTMSAAPVVPLPPTCLLFLFGLVGMAGIKRKFS